METQAYICGYAPGSTGTGNTKTVRDVAGPVGGDCGMEGGKVIINEKIRSKLFNCGKQPKKTEERCFGLDDYGKCDILLGNIKKDCKTCSFFKTKEDFEKDREKALTRLKTLDKTTRYNIAEKYKIKKELLNIPQQSIDRGV